MNEPSNPVFCPLQILFCKFSFNPTLQNRSNQDEAGGKELRDRMIAPVCPGCGKSKIRAIRVSERCLTWPTPAGRRINQTAPSS